MQDNFEKVFKDKDKIMFVFSHPDDAEIYSGGTIARLTAAGKEVRVVKMTYGNKGSRQEEISEDELKKTRIEEDAKSMEILGVTSENNIMLGVGDGEVENTNETVELVVRQIRQFKPEIIVTHNPDDTVIRFAKDENWISHKDHRNTGKCVLDAAMPYSRDLLFFPEHFKEGLDSHIVTEFLLVDYYGHEDEVFFDVKDFHKTRTKAIAAHASQYSLEDAQGSTDFFTLHDDGSRFERFRYVVAD